MDLLLVLVILVVLSGGLGFGGFVALGSLTWVIQLLFAILVIALLLSLIRRFMGGPPVNPMV